MLKYSLLLLLLVGQVRAAPCNLFALIRQSEVDGMASCLNVGGATLANTAAAGGVTPLHLAAAMDRCDMVKLLVAHGAWIDAPSAGGFTPLHWAAAENATNVLQLLVESGADLAAMTDNGITPLHWAASRNATNSVRLLIRAGVAVASQTKSGRTPLHWALTQHSEDAAVMLAFQSVNEGIDLPRLDLAPVRVTAPGTTNIPSPIATPLPDTLPDITMSGRPIVVLQDTPLPRSGDTHRVLLGREQILTFVWRPEAGVWAGAFEVSNGQFRRFRPDHDSRSRESISLNDDDQPAVYVSWYDARAFCEWVNTYYRHSMPAGTYCRLPTNEEWMTLARCGSQRRYPWGNDWPPVYGNHSDRSARDALPDWHGIEEYDDGHIVTCKTSESGVNEWGLYGIAGNVWEWCEDWYAPAPHQLKVRQGGGWDFEDPISLEIETRGFDTPDSRYDTIGFRIVLAPVE
ncbi:MAG: SUMF1/EgtB/PvdO family nonheme iron enzyme [Lentisphaerae bacterium]|nr:SUMF1/EgtB/PvdO family nonheme iron enzyme [Lentisphaerota bacterium]